MLNWAKKHVRHKHKDADDDQKDSEREQSSDRKEGSGRKSSPDKRQGSEKRTPSFARRLASIRKLGADRKSPEKGSRGKSISPEKGLRAESRSPDTTRKPDEITGKIEPSHKEPCDNESSSSEIQPSPDHRASPKRQSLENQEANSSPTLSPTVCLRKETQPDLEQKPSEDADHTQTSSQLTTKDSQSDNHSGSAGDTGVDEAQKCDTHATTETCVIPGRNEGPERDRSPESDLRSNPASSAVRETGSRNLHDLVIRESDEYENTDSREKSNDLNLVTPEVDEKSSCKLNTVENDERTCENEVGLAEHSDSTALENIDNDVSKEVTNGVHEESTTADAGIRRSSEDLQTKGQVAADGLAEPIQTEGQVVADGLAEPVQTDGQVVADELAEPIQTEGQVVADELAEPIQTEGQLVPDGPAERIQTEGQVAADGLAEPVQTEGQVLADGLAEPVQTEGQVVADGLAEPAQKGQVAADGLAEPVQTEDRVAADGLAEPVQMEGQVVADGLAEPHQGTATDQRDTTLQLPVLSVAGGENDLTQSSDITSPDTELYNNTDRSLRSPNPLEENATVDQSKPLVEGSDPLKDRDPESSEIIKDIEEQLSLMSVSQKYIIEIPPLTTDPTKNSKEPPVRSSDTKISKEESEAQVTDSTEETASQANPPKDIEEVADNNNKNISAPPPVSSKKSALSKLRGPLKDDETPLSIPLSEPPDDIDVPPPLPESEPPEEIDEPQPLPLRNGLSITKKPPLPPKSDMLKCSVSKDVVERPLPISPFSAFNEKNKIADLAHSSGAHYDTEGKNQPIVPHGGSEPHSLDSSHSEVDDKLLGSLPSSLNISCDDDAAKVLVAPSPARRLSRGSDVKDTVLISQPSSMSTSYDGSHICTEHKSLVSVSGGSSSSAVGGSLPSSPSAPRRTRRPHPVPAARSLQTLDTAVPAKKTVTTTENEEQITKDTPKVSPEPPGLNTHPENLPREIPVPKPRKIIALNPFESDEDEAHEGQQTIPPKQIPVPKPRKIVSLNPFDSDDDEPEIQSENSKAQVKEFPGRIYITSAKMPAIGKNPFEDDDDDEMEENSFSPGESEFRPMRSSSPATHSLSSSHSSLSPRHLNDSLVSITSQSSKIANESTSTNPFDEDDEYDETRGVHNGLIRETLSRKSFSVTSSSPLQRDVGRSSLPPATRSRTGRKKRLAPLPPGYRPAAMSTSTLDQRLVPDIASSPKGGSTLLMNQEPQRRGSVTSMSSLTSSPKKAAPPRPPPPRVKSNFMTK